MKSIAVCSCGTVACRFVAVFSPVDRLSFFFGRSSRVRPGSRSLFLASHLGGPQESKQKEGDPGPCARYAGSRRSDCQGGKRKNSLRSDICASDPPCQPLRRLGTRGLTSKATPTSRAMSTPTPPLPAPLRRRGIFWLQSPLRQVGYCLPSHQPVKPAYSVRPE
jgi:hypothetical protein